MFSRRRFLRLTAAAATLPPMSEFAEADGFPTRPVHLVVGFAPGQAIDIVARLTAEWLTGRLGQQFIVDNRPGAAGNIAAEMAMRATADGYTLLIVGANNAINATLYDNLKFDLLRDMIPVAGIYRVPQVMEVNPSFPAHSIPEFIDYAKANPGKINFASAGTGSVAHVSGELFKMMTGISMQHVPYRGAAPAVTDLLGGRVDVMFDNIPSSIELIKAGKLRPLGVTSLTRLDLLPDVPLVADFVPGFETEAFAGIGAPKGTPVFIVEKLNNEVSAGLTDPKLRTRIADLGGRTFPRTPAQFGRHFVDETEKWAKVIRAANVKPD
jgi:tripartite-type tricarboxylate transporter receptor subunit TctC